MPLLFCALALPAYAAQAMREVAEFITAKGTDERLSPRPALKLTPLTQPDESFPTVMVDTSKAFQTISRKKVRGLKCLAGVKSLNDRGSG